MNKIKIQKQNKKLNMVITTITTITTTTQTLNAGVQHVHFEHLA